MPYKVHFTGLAAFVEREPGMRLVRLRDGRVPRQGGEPVLARITVRSADVLSFEWWGSPVVVGEFSSFPIEEPSAIVLSGMGTGAIGPDPGAIAQIPIPRGTLRTTQTAASVGAELTVPHDDVIVIEAITATEERKSLTLKPGANITIANVSTHGPRPLTRGGTRNVKTRGRGKPILPPLPDFGLGPTATFPASVEARPAPPADIPREFYALVDAPAHVVAAVEFRLTAGITSEAQGPGDVKLELPPSVTGPYDLTLSVQATGFTFRDDLSVFTLPVTNRTPYPTVDIYLTADIVAEAAPQTIAVFYSVAGQVIGSVERTITVHLEENDDTRAAAHDALRRTFSLPSAQEPPDLTVMIRDNFQGKLAWSFITPHKVVTPSKPAHTDIAGNSRTFAATLTNNANAREGSAGLYEFLLGTGADVRKAMSPLFWPLLAKVTAASKKQTPTVLIISNEPFVPWELAAFPDNAKLPHPDLAPLLGVQTCVGRWLIGDRLPPPRAHTVRHAYVFSGVYALSKFGRLVNAEEEARLIGETYGATPVEAKQEQILGIFAKEPAADLLHFSMHGKFDHDGIEDGLIPIDGGSVKPQMITGAIEEAKKKKKSRIAPFVFLNACQVGSGSRILGDYGGMAAAFINGGATGVVAPLWKVKDETAKEIALAFYKATLAEGLSPAEAIRRARASFVQATKPVSATYLAYQFFGHPSLELRKED